MNRRENLIRAIEFRCPDHVPLNGGFAIEKYNRLSECVCTGYHSISQNEWGYSFEVLREDKTMGQVTKHPLKSLEDIYGWQAPALELDTRFKGVREWIKQKKEEDYFVWGAMGSFVFERMHFLRGMIELFEDMYLEPECFQEFGDKIVTYQCEIIRKYAELGVDGIWGGDDWGVQDRLMIAPEKWREFFKPWYKKMFFEAKKYGLKTYMHSCGKNNKIIRDLIECGLDVIELHQPNVYDVNWLSENCGGKICFSTTADIQMTLPYDDLDKIEQEVKDLKEKLGCFNGGLINIIYGDPDAINIKQSTMDYYIEKCRQYSKY